MITVIRGDITDSETGCIVNAAKPSLLGGGGVDGAIHKAAGPKLRKECLALNGCLPGKAVVTGGYELKSDYVIHTVAPRYGACNGREEEILKGCYIESIKHALSRGIESIAFPAIGTGAYGFPREAAAKIAVAAVNEALSDTQQLNVVFVVSTEEEKLMYQSLLSNI